MSELQAGMLALVVGAKHCHENIGKIVTVESFHKAGEPYGNGVFKRDLFLCKGENLVASFSMGVSGEIVKIPGDMAFCSRANLLPIKPEADPLDVTHKEELHA